MSLVENYLHIIFRTYRSYPSIPEAHKRELFMYIMALCKEKKVYLKRINAFRDHVHMLINLPPTYSLADFMEKLKSHTSRTLQHSSNFPEFNGWNKGYGAFSISHWDIDKIAGYIASQESHHTRESADDEMKRLLRENGFEIDEYIDRNM